MCDSRSCTEHVSAAEDENGALVADLSRASLFVSPSLSLSLTPRNTKSINNVTVEAI